MTVEPARSDHVVEQVPRAMAPALRLATVATLALALVGLVGGSAGRVAGSGALVIVIGVPLVRVAWLGVQWWRNGDRRFALAAAALLVVVLGGVALAAALG